MTWPVPEPGAIKARYDAAFVRALGYDGAGLPLAQTPDTSSPDTVLYALGAAGEETWTEAYGYQQSLAAELMPDTAQDWLSRHGSDWGVPRAGGGVAVGSLVFVGVANLPLPLGIVAGTGPFWETTTPAVIGPSGAVSVPARALASGSASNLAGGAVLPLVSPIAGLSVQSCTVDAAGMADGTDLEDLETWRARILDRIRNPGQAGSRNDYRRWASAAGAPYCGVYRNWMGDGTVGLVVAMAGPSLATPAVVQAVADYVDDRRPVTADVYVVAAELLVVDVVLQVYPDSVGVRAGVQAALAAQFLLDADVGKVLPRSRLIAACASATGQYANQVVAPAIDVVPAANQVPVLGTVTFVTGYAPVSVLA